MGRGIHRGFITHEELSKSLGKRNLSEEKGGTQKGQTKATAEKDIEDKGVKY